jgi:hypothetical protein
MLYLFFSSKDKTLPNKPVQGEQEDHKDKVDLYIYILNPKDY